VSNASVAEWQAEWMKVNGSARELGGWTSPWLDESWRDGNPIFSAWSPTLRRGLRIIQHEEPDRFIVWRNTFGGRGSSDAVDELVISCALTEGTLDRVRGIMRDWVESGELLR
jgi:hypothetical protein